MSKKTKTIKAWAIIFTETGEICHYLDGKELRFYRFKKDAKSDFYWKWYKAVPVEIKILK